MFFVFMFFLFKHSIFEQEADVEEDKGGMVREAMTSEPTSNITTTNTLNLTGVVPELLEPKRTGGSTRRYVFVITLE